MSKRSLRPKSSSLPGPCETPREGGNGWAQEWPSKSFSFERTHFRALGCEVRKGEHGRPYLHFFLKLESGRSVSCSLSHKDEYALAAFTASAGIRLGVDLEKISPRLARLRSRFINKGDCLLVPAAEEASSAALWALKEAASKVAGSGLRSGLHNFVCREKDEKTCMITPPQGLSLKATYFLLDDYVAAVVWAADDPGLASAAVDKTKGNPTGLLGGAMGKQERGAVLVTGGTGGLVKPVPCTLCARDIRSLPECEISKKAEELGRGWPRPEDDLAGYRGSGTSEAAAGLIKDSFGKEAGLSGLINNAGIALSGPLEFLRRSPSGAFSKSTSSDRFQ